MCCKPALFHCCSKLILYSRVIVVIMMSSILPEQYKRRNYLHSVFWLSGMLALLSLVGWLLAGPAGITWFILVGVFAFISAPRLTPNLIMRLHRARALQPGEAPQLFEVVSRLAARADINTTPLLYYVPGNVINAFTTGLNDNAAIALSDGLLRRLNARELSGILAHEISHISNNDLLLMMIANVVNRLTSFMAFAGFILVWLYIPMFIFASEQAPWLLLVVLMTAPTFSALMQLALSRSREFNADAAAAKLTGDPLGLVSALEKIDQYQGGWFERMVTPRQHMRDPVFFRTHPLMTDRIARLKKMASTMNTGDVPVNYAE